MYLKVRNKDAWRIYCTIRYWDPRAPDLKQPAGSNSFGQNAARFDRAATGK